MSKFSWWLQTKREEETVTKGRFKVKVVTYIFHWFWYVCVNLGSKQTQQVLSKTLLLACHKSISGERYLTIFPTDWLLHTVQRIWILCLWEYISAKSCLTFIYVSICYSENKDGVVAAVCNMVDWLPRSPWESPGHMGRRTGKSVLTYTHICAWTHILSKFLNLIVCVCVCCSRCVTWPKLWEMACCCASCLTTCCLRPSTWERSTCAHRCPR